MNQGLQSAALFRAGGSEGGVGRKQPGQKMMLVGEARQPQTTELGLFGQTGPFHVRRQITLPDPFQNRQQNPMIGIALQGSGAPARRVKFRPRQAVIGREHNAGT